MSYGKQVTTIQLAPKRGRKAMADEQTATVDPKAERQKQADETNKSRSGISTRVFVGMTRGKNPQVISWEAFDDSIPESMPKKAEEFLEATKATEAQVLNYLIVGYNETNYQAASDPLAEYVNPAWSDELQAQFRIVVRNYAKGSDTPLDEAVEMLKPGFERKHAKELAALAAAAAEQTQETVQA